MWLVVVFLKLIVAFLYFRHVLTPSPLLRSHILISLFLLLVRRQEQVGEVGREEAQEEAGRVDRRWLPHQALACGDKITMEQVGDES